MRFDTLKLAAIVAAAKSAASSPSRLRAIEKAASALMNGELIVTTLIDSHALVSSTNVSYWINSSCQCKAAKAGHRECCHKVAARMVEIYEVAPTVKTKPVTTASTITRSIETDYTGVKCVTVRCNGWLI